MDEQQLEAENDRLRAEIARKDEEWRKETAKLGEFLNKFSEEKAREAARLALEHMRTITLAPGEYAILELGHIEQDMMVAIIDGVPDDLRGRIIVVDGKVHTLKLEETP